MTTRRRIDSTMRRIDSTMRSSVTWPLDCGLIHWLNRINCTDHMVWFEVTSSNEHFQITMAGNP